MKVESRDDKASKSKEFHVYVQPNHILLTTTETEKTWPECFEVVVSEINRRNIPRVIDVLKTNFKISLDDSADEFLGKRGDKK